MNRFIESRLRAKGFTLVEVLVALGIVAIALAAGVRSTASLTRNAERQSDLLLAQLCAENALVAVRLDRIKRLDQLKTGREDLLAQWRRSSAVGRHHLLAEVLQVLTEVEHVELGLVITWPEQIGTKPGAATQHLPEFRL